MLNFEMGCSRRGFLCGSIGLGALMLPRMKTQAASHRRGRARSVIVLLLEGGMSHLDTWDLKPAAPREIRGEFHTIATSNPGLRISEHMPRLARQAHRYNVIRSVHSSANNHSPGLHWVLTGFDNPKAGVNRQRINEVPSVGSIVADQLGSTTSDGLPRFVAVPNRSQLGGRVHFSGAAYLGEACEAFETGAVPGSADGRYRLPTGLTLPQSVSLRRLEDRRRLLDNFDRLQQQRDRALAVQEGSEFQQQAFDLLLGNRARQAFDINREPPEVRRRYGDSRMGQATLMARRLVEAGVSYVLVNYSRNNSWDTHRSNFKRLKNSLLPPMDQAASALLEDLDQRSLLDETLVLLIGEMGRTPVINNRDAGRDHWPDVYSAMLAGGGLTGGQVLGSSTPRGEKPKDRPVHLDDVLATVYAQLGIDPRLMIYDRQDRPVPILPAGQPVGELMA